MWIGQHMLLLLLHRQVRPGKARLHLAVVQGCLPAPPRQRMRRAEMMAHPILLQCQAKGETHGAVQGVPCIRGQLPQCL